MKKNNILITAGAVIVLIVILLLFTGFGRDEPPTTGQPSPHALDQSQQ
ncbi:hypothetical protein HFO98_25825 [Rhizobium leguminosarum]|nr:hypothetical protein [Rhizobium leguminosarum]MBY5358496.1 hypothetical protein [Rhizobium leguminosarum]MBY5411814.1 hypothetical protein [Rhizobium leguminosarum]